VMFDSIYFQYVFMDWIFLLVLHFQYFQCSAHVCSLFGLLGQVTLTMTATEFEIHPVIHEVTSVI